MRLFKLFSILALATYVASFPVIAEANHNTGAYFILDQKDTGIDGESLSTTPVTDTIQMEDPLGNAPVLNPEGHTNMLSLHIEIVWGSTTFFTVACEGGINFPTRTSNTLLFGDIYFCDANAASTCDPDVRTYDTTAKTKFWHDVASNYPFMRCTFTGTGTGTIVVKGVRGHQ